MMYIILNRKSGRLKGYNYAKQGMYFVTICTKNREQILSRIEIDNKKDVGAGLAFAQFDKFNLKLTNIGIMLNDVIINLPKRFNIKIDEYVIMPDHIHIIIQLNDDKKRADTRPAPTLSDVICVLKSCSAIKYLEYNKKLVCIMKNYGNAIIMNILFEM